MSLQIEACGYELKFKYPFGIAHGTRNGTDALFIRAKEQGNVGYGEAALPPYLGYDLKKLLEAIPLVNRFILGNKELEIEELRKSLQQQYDIFPTPLIAAIDCALWDLEGNIKHKSAEELIDADTTIPLCSFTLGYSSVEDQRMKLRDARDFRLFKFKLGSDIDRERILDFKKENIYNFCVDANQAWQSIHYSIKETSWLKEQGCIFIEQPFKTNNLEDLANLYNVSELPIILDESIQNIESYLKVRDLCDGINIKLVKCGGITPALELIKLAKKDDKLILIGCMSEGSCGAAAASCLSGFADFVDLDGPVLTANDPFKGIIYHEGKIIKEKKTGTGCTISKDLVFEDQLHDMNI
jgi:L-alanine-DL-glutamate epimerase-like enolase superfamily enzyme